MIRIGPVTVFGFDTPHKLGTVCGNPCEQCDFEPMVLTGADCKPLPPIPLFIIREATEQEWADEVRTGGGLPYKGTARWFYWVRAAD